MVTSQHLSTDPYTPPSSEKLAVVAANLLQVHKLFHWVLCFTNPMARTSPPSVGEPQPKLVLAAALDYLC